MPWSPLQMIWNSKRMLQLHQHHALMQATNQKSNNYLQYFLQEKKQPETPNEPSTSTIEKNIQEVLDDIKNKKGNVRRSRKPCEWNPKFIFYCDSHGCNKTHHSDKYENEKKFHDDNATFTNPNPKLGIMWNKDVYMGS